MSNLNVSNSNEDNYEFYKEFMKEDNMNDVCYEEKFYDDFIINGENDGENCDEEWLETDNSICGYCGKRSSCPC